MQPPPTDPSAPKDESVKEANASRPCELIRASKSALDDPEGTPSETSLASQPSELIATDRRPLTAAPKRDDR